MAFIFAAKEKLVELNVNKILLPIGPTPCTTAQQSSSQPAAPSDPPGLGREDHLPRSTSTPQAGVTKRARRSDSASAPNKRTETFQFSYLDKGNPVTFFVISENKFVPSYRCDSYS